MAKVLVTGGAGFIGSHLTEKLVRGGHDVTVIDNLLHGTTENVESVIKDIELVNGDILNQEVREKAVKGKEYIFHLAANTSVNMSIEEPSRSAMQNIMATVGLLESAVKHNAARVIFSSTAAVYGYCDKLPIEENAPLIPASPYGLEKVVGEKYMQLFAKLYDIDTVSLRYFNVFGPRQNADLPHPGGVTIVINQIRENRCSQLFGDGTQTRDMIYVENVVNANILAMEKDSACEGTAYNISTVKSVTISDLHEKISDLMNVKSTREHLPLPEGNIIRSLGDNSLAKRELRFEVEVDMEEGLRKTIEWSGKEK